MLHPLPGKKKLESRSRSPVSAMDEEATYRAGQKIEKPPLTHQLGIPQPEGRPKGAPPPLAPERCLLGPAMFRLLSGHEWSVGGEAREGSEREREREGIFSERKQKWDIHRGPSPSPLPSSGPRQSVGGCGHAKSGPSRSGQRYDDLRRARGTPAATPASFVSWRVQSGVRLLGNGLEGPS